jgi:hypothetical protein
MTMLLVNFPLGVPGSSRLGFKTQLTDIPQIAVGFTFTLLPFLSPDKAKPVRLGFSDAGRDISAPIIKIGGRLT